MTLHPALQAMVDKAAEFPPMENFTPDQIRSGEKAMFAVIPRPDVASVEDKLIPGPRGDIRVRIYRPDAENGHPVITFFHGSGFVICSLDTHDGLCRQICNRAHAVVVSVDYALAPENKFPAGPDDALAAARWVADHAAEFGGDPARLAVCGDSAGATMATVTAIRLRDAGASPVKAQVLIYPVTNYPDPAPPSYVERGSSFGLTDAAMRYFWRHYLNSPEEGQHPHASPLRADDLTGLPPAYVITAEYDVLRDEGVAYAHRLTAASVDTTLVHYADANHGYMSYVGMVDRADETLDAICAWLKPRL